MNKLPLLPALWVFLLSFPLSTNAQCPTSITGFTALGEWNDHHYYLSDDPAQWNSARATAASHGGYLASINSQAENDFLLSQINNIVFIGYNDALLEGSFAWDSGESVTFNNLTANNSANKDYANMNFWSGTWDLDGQYVSRPYILELECAGSGIMLTCPSDITVTASQQDGNFVFSNWELPVGSTDCPEGGLVITQRPTTPPLGVQLFDGDYIITYDAIDACGNTTSCSFTYTVERFPYSGGFSFCPEDLTMTADDENGAIVFWDDPIGSTTCPGSSLSQVTGPENGSLLPIGTTELIYLFLTTGPAYGCNNLYECRFTVTVLPPDSGGTCPSSIAGFTVIGELGNSKYFLSNTPDQPLNAQAIAEANGGHLVTINSSEENAFLQANINEMTYIGLNDYDEEGSLEWLSGEAVTYSNVNPCDFCNQNSPTFDFLVIQPWDGAWSFSNVFNARPYLIEIPCNGNPEPEEDCSFLIPIEGEENLFVDEGDQYRRVFLDNTNLPTTIVREEVIDNQGNEGVPVEYSVNLPVGYTEVQRSQLGDYVLTYDTNDDNTELTLKAIDFSSNELWSNTYSLVFDDPDIAALGIGGVLESESGYLIWGTYRFNNTGNWRLFLITADAQGNLLDRNVSELLYDFPRFNQLSLSNEGGFYLSQITGSRTYVLYKIDLDAQIAWTQPITGDLVSRRVYYVGPTEDGSVVYFGVYLDPYTEFRKYDAATGELLWSQMMAPQGTLYERSSYAGAAITADGGLAAAITYINFTIAPTRTGYRCGRFDEAGNILWSYELPEAYSDLQVKHATTSDDLIFEGDYNGENVWMKINGDGQFTPYCGGQTAVPDLEVDNITEWAYSTRQAGESVDVLYDLNNNNFASTTAAYTIDIYLSPSDEFNNAAIYISTIDRGVTPFGSIIGESVIVDIPADLPEGNYYLYFVVDEEGVIAETDELNNVALGRRALIENSGSADCPTDVTGFTTLGDFGNHRYYLSEGLANAMTAEAEAQALGGHLVVINSAAENDFVFQNISEIIYLGLSDAQAEGSPAWVNGDPLSYTNYDLCNFCGANTASNDYAIMHSWNGGWSWTNAFSQRKYIVEVDCMDSNIPALRNTVEHMETGNKPKLLTLFPNPVENRLVAQVNSVERVSSVLQVFDARGMLQISQTIELLPGHNTYEINTSDLPSGIYYLHLLDAQHRQGQLRFIKARD